MGEVKVPQCDIFKTLQPKGLRSIEVIVNDITGEDSEPLFVNEVAVSTRGAERVLRMVKAACQPPKTREAKADVP